MALISRVARLFRADFHAVLDRVEEPDTLLRQAIREMEEELSRVDQRYRRHQQEQGRLSKQRAEMEGLHASLSDQLDVCLGAGKEDLARAVIRRKLETEQALRLLDQRHQGLAQQLEQLAEQRGEKRSRYESMRQKAELFDEQHRDSESEDAWRNLDIRVRDEDVEVVLLRERQRRTKP